ncbi:MAG: hypothetical protein QE278_13890 [Limnobacter sp.]|nr:hypothetical protein [Limnobacter sp.]
MIKRTTLTLALLAATASFHSASFATGCTVGSTDPACTSNITTNVTVKTNVDLDVDSKGVFVQLNSGDITSVIDISNLKMINEGDINVTSTAVANNFSVNLIDNSTGPMLKHIHQKNTGDVTSIIDITQSAYSKPGDVLIDSTAVANNFSFTRELATNGTSLAELSIAQCNTGDVTSLVSFARDPLSLAVNSTAVGNNIAINVGKAAN